MSFTDNPRELRLFLDDPPFPLDEIRLSTPLVWYRADGMRALHADISCGVLHRNGAKVVREHLNTTEAARGPLCPTCFRLGYDDVEAYLYFNAVSRCCREMDVMTALREKVKRANPNTLWSDCASLHWRAQRLRANARLLGDGEPVVAAFCDRVTQLIEHVRASTGADLEDAFYEHLCDHGLLDAGNGPYRLRHAGDSPQRFVFVAQTDYLRYTDEMVEFMFWWYVVATYGNHLVVQVPTAVAEVLIAHPDPRFLAALGPADDDDSDETFAAVIALLGDGTAPAECLGLARAITS